MILQINLQELNNTSLSRKYVKKYFNSKMFRIEFVIFWIHKISLLSIALNIIDILTIGLKQIKILTKNISALSW